MKYTIALMMCLFTPTALANSVTVCKDDQLIISSKDIRIVSQDHADVKISHDCDLKISPDSKVVVKNNGNKINEKSRLRVLVDNKSNVCSVVQIV
jgi:hypothetical protein